MPLVTLKCTRCGGELPPTRPGESCTCPYCGQTFAFEGDAVPAPTPVPARARVRMPTGAVVALAVTIVATVGGSIAAIVLSGNGATSVAPRVVPERFLWDEVGGPPQLGRAAGREILVARFRAGSDDQLYVEAREPPALTRRWRAGPFGTYEEGYQATWFQIVGQRVVVTEVRAKAHVYDLASGAELGTFPLSDRPTRDGLEVKGGLVRVATADGKHWAIDPQALTISRTAAPPPGPSWQDDDVVPREQAALLAREAPQVRGFRATKVLIDGPLGVAVGHREPGTPVPHVVGFDPATRAVRWTSDVASTDPTLAEAVSAEGAAILEGGRLLVAFHQKEGYRLTAFDARDGRRLWEAPLPPRWLTEEPRLVAGAGYCYLTCDLGLAALDPADGHVLGAISPFPLTD